MKSKIIIIIILAIIIVAGAVLASKIIKDQEQQYGTVKNLISVEPEIFIEEKKPKTWAGNERAIAVMIDNSKSAWPHGGLNDADLVYEIIVEGGETRIMAIFKGKNISKIGSVRSARHYFLDYVLENDAIYTHFGWSPQAQSDISSLNVDNINGISESETSFWRTKDKYAPHNVATNTEKILEIAQRKEYRIKSNKESVLNYSVEEVNLEKGVEIEEVTIPYSYLHKVSYSYDSENKVFVRLARGEEQVDWTTEEKITAKNIIITFAQNYTLTDSENKGRQGLKNVGTLKGYYITNGKYIEITCEKSSRASQTVYKTLDGEEITVNDGNTFVQICPINSDVEFKEVVKEEIVQNTIE